MGGSVYSRRQVRRWLGLGGVHFSSSIWYFCWNTWNVTIECMWDLGIGIKLLYQMWQVLEECVCFRYLVGGKARVKNFFGITHVKE